MPHVQVRHKNRISHKTEPYQDVPEEYSRMELDACELAITLAQKPAAAEEKPDNAADLLPPPPLELKREASVYPVSSKKEEEQAMNSEEVAGSKRKRVDEQHEENQQQQQQPARRSKRRAKFTPMPLLDMAQLFDDESVAYILTMYDPYNRRLRHVIRSARAHNGRDDSPFIVENTFRVLKDGTVYSLPINGRNASRYEGAAMDRGMKVMRVADELQLSNVGVCFLNDLGFGSAIARKILQKFRQESDSNNSDPCPGTTSN